MEIIFPIEHKMDKRAYLKGGARIEKLQKSVDWWRKLRERLTNTDEERARIDEMIEKQTQEIEDVKADPFYKDWW
jgi:predicted nuclease with TOPRIM domain